MRNFVASGLPVLALAWLAVVGACWDWLKRDRR